MDQHQTFWRYGTNYGESDIIYQQSQKRAHQKLVVKINNWSKRQGKEA